MNRVELTAEECPLPAWAPRARRFVQKILRRLGRDGGEVSVLFCTNRYIKTLNARFRGVDEPTDVLSFPLWELPGAGEGPGPETKRRGKDTSVRGDIVISLDALEENARDAGIAAGEELRRLLVHGILHLDGRDHATNEPREPMLLLQEELVSEFAGETIL